MSGEGSIPYMPSSIADIRAKIDAHVAQVTAPSWDKRPGALEATDGLELLGVVGKHLEDEWAVGVVLTGHVEIGALSIDEARRFAASIVKLCDTLEHGVPDR